MRSIVCAAEIGCRRDFQCYRLRLESGGTGNFTSTATRFGIDGSGASDVSDLIDGGNGTAESLAFLLSPAVILDSIVISEFDDDDAGTVNLKGIGTFNVSNGVNTFGSPLLGSGSANFIQWTGTNASSATRGFSVDAINVHTVPEPPAVFIAMSAACLAGLRIMRRRAIIPHLLPSSPNWR
jgi:hypothetical protein